MNARIVIFVVLILLITGAVKATEVFVPYRALVGGGGKYFPSDSVGADVQIWARSESGRELKLDAGLGGQHPTSGANYAGSNPTRLTSPDFPSTIVASIDGNTFVANGNPIVPWGLLSIDHEVIGVPPELDMPMDTFYNSAPGILDIEVDFRESVFSIPATTVTPDVLLTGSLGGTMTYAMQQEFIGNNGFPAYRVQSFRFESVPEPNLATSFCVAALLLAMSRRQCRPSQ